MHLKFHETLVELLKKQSIQSRLFQIKIANSQFTMLSQSKGPRFCLNPIRIFDGCFGGPTLYENPTYSTPTAVSLFKILSLSLLYLF